MQRLKHIVQKVAAISAGTIMLGATLTSALAAGTTLKDYPAPFADTAGKAFAFDIVVGEAADAADASAAADIITGLKGVVVGTNTSSTATVAGGETKDIPLGYSLVDSTYGWANNITSTQISTLQDTTISIDLNDAANTYNVQDKVGINPNVKLQTGSSVAAPSDNYGKDGKLAFLEVPSGGITYDYVFKGGSSLKTGNFLTNGSESTPISLNILGNNYDVWCAASSTGTLNQLTALVGTKIAGMKIGDTYKDTASGKTVKVTGIAETSVMVDVEGVSEQITTSSSKTVNGVKIKVASGGIFYDSTNSAARTATLIVGTSTTKTYTNNDKYIGSSDSVSNNVCKTNSADPNCWIWQLSTLDSATPKIGLKWNYGATTTDSVIYLGSKFSLPGGFVTITPQAFTVSEYQGYEISLVQDPDVYNTTGMDAADGTLGAPYKGSLSGKQAVLFTTNPTRSDGYKLGSYNAPSFMVFTNNSLINATGNLDGKAKYFIYMRNSDNKVTGANGGDTGYYYYGSNSSTLPQIYYKDSLFTIGMTNSSTLLSVGIGGSTYMSSTINFTLNTTGKGINSIGADPSIAADADLWVNGTTMTGSTNNIGTYNYDIMTQDGIIIKTPKSNLASDKVVLSVPSKDGTDFRVQLIIGGTGTTVSGAGSTTLGDVAIAPTVKKESEITDKTAKNLILVGGPCVNSLTASFLSLEYPACMDASGYKEGEGYITLKTNGAKVALIVAGWAAADTANAATKLKNYATAELTGAEVKVVAETTIEAETTA